MNDAGSFSASSPGSAGPAQACSAPRADDRRVRLLVVDDHPVVRSGIVGMLSGEPDRRYPDQAPTRKRTKPVSSPPVASTTLPTVVLGSLAKA